jgi:hypothetical protein
MANQLWKPPVDSPVSASPPSLIRYRAFALAGFCISAALRGTLSNSATPWTQILVVFSMSTAATMWCTVDASSRGEYYPHSLRWVTMFTWPIAVPVYLIETRRWRGVRLTALGLAAVIVLELVGYKVGQLLLTPR